MKQFTVTTTYDSDTRTLQSDVSLVGFIPGLPAQAITARQLDTVTLFAYGTVFATDAQAVQASQARALLSCSRELGEWLAAARNKDKADQLPGTSEGEPCDECTLPFDPTEEFENNLDNP